jgi:hypothetical protein
MGSAGLTVLSLFPCLIDLLQNGRVAMLASLGLIVQEFVHLPAPAFTNPLGTEAFFQVPVGGLAQIFLFCGVVELISNKGKVTYGDMFEGDNAGRIPGDLGFNPMGLKVTDSMRLRELKVLVTWLRL